MHGWVRLRNKFDLCSGGQEWKTYDSTDNQKTEESSDSHFPKSRRFMAVFIEPVML